MKVQVFAMVVILSLGIPVLQGANVECDFEAPTYTDGTSFIGVDGWSLTNGDPATAAVTPDSVITGYQTVLSGSQSGVFGSPSNYAAKGFTAASEIGNQTTLSMEIWVDTGAFILFFSNDVVGQATPMGLYMTGGEFQVYSASLGGWTAVPTLTYSEDTNYAIGYDVDFTADTFKIYIENMDGSGRVESGSYSIGSDLNPTDMKASGGVLIGCLATVIDNIETTSIPEPATLSLIGCGILGLLRKRK